MVDKPILFSALMVRELLQDRKTQTRRVVKGWPNAGTNEWQLLGFYDGIAAFRSSGERLEIRCPLHVGSRLWVRENLVRPDGDTWLYAADRTPVTLAKEDEGAMVVWAHHHLLDYCPSIHMPRWASRITLEVTDTRLQRVQEISEGDAEAEGVETWELTAQEIADLQISDENPDVKKFWAVMGPGRYSAVMEYRLLWNSINAKRGFGWDANPWVWAYTFKVVR